MFGGIPLSKNQMNQAFSIQVTAYYVLTKAWAFLKLNLFLKYFIIINYKACLFSKALLKYVLFLPYLPRNLITYSSPISGTALRNLKLV